MSLAFLSKPIGGSKKNADPSSDSPSRAGKPGPVRGSAGSTVAVGGAPRVDLMPPEIRVKRSQLRTRRKLRLALFGVFLVVVAACGGTWVLATLSQTTLAAAQSQQQQLLTQQLAYSDVTTIQTSIGLIKAGQKVGDSTEIDWDAYLTKLQATLPAGVTFSTVTITTTTPLNSIGQSATPLEGSRVATLLFSASSPTLPSIPALLNALKTLPGFVDATPGDVSADGTSGGYTANVTMHINTQAFANRFDPEGAAANKKALDASTTNGGN
jgi:hypothetical protein